MTTDIELLRQEYEQAQAILSAKTRYETALAEQQKQQARVEAEKQVELAESNLESKTAEYQLNLEEVSAEFRDLLGKLYILEQKFIKLSRDADTLSSAANSLALTKARRGDFNELAKSQGLTSIDKLLIDGAGSDEIRRRFKGMSNPLFFSFANLRMGELGLYLLSAPLWQNLKMQFLGKSTQVQPETQPEVHSEIVRTNGHVGPPIESDKKLIDVSEFQQLFRGKAT